MVGSNHRSELRRVAVRRTISNCCIGDHGAQLRTEGTHRHCGGLGVQPEHCGNSVQSLPITISNEGGTCNIGGFPKIVPTGIKVTHKLNGEAVYALVEGVAISSTKYKMLTLRHGKAAYTHLNLVYPFGETATVKRSEERRAGIVC